MPVKLLIALGISTISGVIVEKVLNEVDKPDIADVVGKTNKGILISAAVGSVIYVLVELNKLRQIL